MVKRIGVTTPQFKTDLVRKLKNLYPKCSVEFVDAGRSGIAFRLKDQRGRHCSDVVQIHRNTGGILTKTSLYARVRLTTRWSERGTPKVPTSNAQQRVAQRGR